MKLRLRLFLAFLRDQRGSMSVETVIIMPALLWAFMAMFVYWDLFRTNNAHVKATYVVSDMITRELNSITMADINGLHSVYRYVSAANEPTWMRVTSIQYRASNDTYRVLWSRSTDTAKAPQLNNGTLAAVRGGLPEIADTDTLILVETWRDYTPTFSIGLGERTFSQFMVARPRWLSPIPLTS
jgi:Flp pilus assembly protein TadG